MTTTLLILQILIIIALATIILLQKPSSDGLSGLSGGGHNFISSKTTTNVFYKTTMFLGAAFMINSLLLAKFIVNERKQAESIIQSIETDEALKVKESQKVIKENQAPIAK